MLQHLANPEAATKPMLLPVKSNVFIMAADAACIPDSRLKKLKELGAGSYATGAIKDCLQWVHIHPRQANTLMGMVWLPFQPRMQ